MAICHLFWQCWLFVYIVNSQRLIIVVSIEYSEGYLYNIFLWCNDITLYYVNDWYVNLLYSYVYLMSNFKIVNNSNIEYVYVVLYEGMRVFGMDELGRNLFIG